MQATRPRVLIAPLQIGLGVQMHHHFASKFLIDSLYHHGYSSSYSEVKKFETNAAASQGIDIPGYTPGSFVQYVADNVDHNVRTLDGFNTFHGMGIIATMTPGTKTFKPVPRVCTDAGDIAAIGRIGIHFYKSEWNGLTSITYEKLPSRHEEDATSGTDLLWKISWLLKGPRPGWSGMMQAVHTGIHPGQSSVTFLPMIDMSSSDMSCIYSTLKFVGKQARQYQMTPIITFDQPLWWKAQTIIASEPSCSDLRSTILRLGAFHTEMSFLGCMGHLMAGSGLRDLLELVYASNAVGHILTGKAIARAVRAHFLVDTVLNSLLVSNAFDYPLRHDEESSDEQDSTEQTENSSITDDDLREAADVFDKLMAGDVSVEDVCQEDVLTRIEQRLTRYKTAIKDKRTCVLWLQYMDMVDILRRFIKAERLGDWKLHLQSLTDMLPYFASSGHNLYAKSARLYLQNMLDLENHHPEVFRRFEMGYHVVRRSDRLWAGLPTDLVIEQVLMRSMKTCGGLTRGRGMGEIQRLTWLLSMPSCAAVNISMQDFTGIAFNTSEQNKDMTQARQQRDQKDMQTLLTFLEDKNPFSEDKCLRNIASGETADTSVNADHAVEVGQKIMDSMNGENVLTFSFKKKDQVVTLSAKSAVKVDGELIQVDPQLLFQRLIATAETFDGSLAAVFKYELCSVPPALFDSSGLPREANKPALADALWTLMKTPDVEPPVQDETHYVLDGGALLQRVIWPRGATYNAIIQLYTDYVSRKYGTATIVFDGYDNGPSTKDITHLRRKQGVGSKVNFTGTMILCSKKEEFLANETNKQRFIHMLGDALEDIGCKITHATGDADALIVQKAVESATDKVTVLIGEDTDLLVLLGLCYHASLDSHDVFFMSEQKMSVKKKRKIWNIKEVKRTLGTDICNAILFAHAILGCDTTSRVFGIGKGVVLKKLKSEAKFRALAAMFQKTSTKEEVIAAGEQAMVTLYQGESGVGLDNLRHRRFCEKVAASKSFVQPRSLPPTSAAAQYHSLRVYFQVRDWIGDKPDDMLAQDWGWEVRHGRLYPVHTDMPPAPQELLRIIRCNCKTDCSSPRCSCRKHGLDCSLGCGECRGVSCANSPRIDLEGVDFDD